MERERLPKREIEVLPPLKEVRKDNNGRFIAGNKSGIGNRGPSANPRPRFMTQALISQLNEIDPRTDRAKFGKIVENLIKNAMGYELRERIVDRQGRSTGKTRIIEVPPDMDAIKYIFDRLEGKPKQNLGMDGDDMGGKLTVIFEPVDKEL